MSYPQRIVCLAAEAPEIIAELDAMERVVAVSGFTRTPAARGLPKVGGFANPHLDKVAAFAPDLVITISDIQADAAADLIRRGIPVLALNPHRLADVWRNILLVGGALGLPDPAQGLVQRLQQELQEIHVRYAPPESAGASRPRVYFEEWHDPLISGIGWVSDLIGRLGGEDIFAELAGGHKAHDRVVAPQEVAARRPDVIIASWCGKKARLDEIRARPGWGELPAVQSGALYDLPSNLILQTGPSLVQGAEALARMIHTTV